MACQNETTKSHSLRVLNWAHLLSTAQAFSLCHVRMMQCSNATSASYSAACHVRRLAVQLCHVRICSAAVPRPHYTVQLATSAVMQCSYMPRPHQAVQLATSANPGAAILILAVFYTAARSAKALFPERRTKFIILSAVSMILLSTCLVPKSAGFVLPGHLARRTLPSCTAHCSHNVGVLMCLIRPAPRREAIPKPAVASIRRWTGLWSWIPMSLSKDTVPNPMLADFTAA